MSNKNFVSVSGISNLIQLKAIEKITKEETFTFPLAIGYQFSSSSINLGTQNTRQPLFTETGDLVKATLNYRMIPSIHYYTKDQETIISDLEKLIKKGVDPKKSLLQFNTLPPSLQVLQKVKQMGWRVMLL